MTKKEIQEYIKYLRSRPEEYVELVSGCKLHWYQKVLLRMMFKMEDKKNKNTMIFKNGSIVMSIPTNKVVRSKIKYPVYYDEFEGDSE